MAVQFDEEEKFNAAFRTQISTPAGLTAWFIKQGWAKDERSAKNIMTIITVICFALAIYFAIK